MYSISKSNKLKNYNKESAFSKKVIIMRNNKLWQKKLNEINNLYNGVNQNWNYKR